MAKFAYEKLKLRQVAVVAHINPWAEIITPAFQSEFEQLGGKVVYNEALNPDQTDFKSTITKLKSKNPDAIYLPMVPMSSADFLNQLRQQNIQVPLLGGDAIIQDVVDASKGGAEGLYKTDSWTNDSEKLKELYQAKFKAGPIDTTLVALGYDGMTQLLHAAKVSQDSSISLRDALEKLYGPTHSADRLQKIFKISNAKSEILNED